MWGSQGPLVACGSCVMLFYPSARNAANRKDALGADAREEFSRSTRLWGIYRIELLM
jgi:hypothetical protein